MVHCPLQLYDYLFSPPLSTFKPPKSHTPRSRSSTYITLIPMKDKSEDYNDFHPLSLCNLIYKVVTKIISNINEPFFKKSISMEHFGFLYNHQILNVVGVDQECMHSIKIKNIQSFILMMDLIKDYDRVDWTILRFVLIQTGLPVEISNRMMSCISHLHFLF